MSYQYEYLNARKKSPMGRIKRVKVREVIQTLPKLSSIGNCRNKKLRCSKMKGLNSSQKDILCRCLHWAQKIVPQNAFSKKELKKIAVDSEAIKFLINLNKFSEKKRRDLDQERDEILQQSGRGLSLYLGKVIPTVSRMITRNLNSSK